MAMAMAKVVVVVVGMHRIWASQLQMSSTKSSWARSLACTVPTKWPRLLCERASQTPPHTEDSYL
jgi:hypothetical protein